MAAPHAVSSWQGSPTLAAACPSLWAAQSPLLGSQVPALEQSPFAAPGRSGAQYSPAGQGALLGVGMTQGMFVRTGQSSFEVQPGFMQTACPTSCSPANAADSTSHDSGAMQSLAPCRGVQRSRQ